MRGFILKDLPWGEIKRLWKGEERLAAKRMLSKAGIWQRNILILEAGRAGEMVLERVKKNKNMGYEPIGFLDDDEAKLGKKIGGLKVLEKLKKEDLLVRYDEDPFVVFEIRYR